VSAFRVGMERLTVLLVITLLTMPFLGSVAHAYRQGIRVIVDGHELLSDVPPQVVEGRTLLPLRLVFEALGAEVFWNPTNQMIIVLKDDTELLMRVGKPIMGVNGDFMQLDVAPSIYSNRTFVPVRVVAEALGATVEWNGDIRAVVITTASDGDGSASASSKPPVSSALVTAEDMEIMVRAIASEATGEPFLGKVAVGAVIVNRVMDSYFPNSIREVVFQPRQFSVIGDGRFFSIHPTKQDYEAAREALRGTDPSYGALYFYNPRKTRDWFVHSRHTLVVIGGHRFAR